MKTHLRYESQSRAETDQSVIDNLVRKGWEVFTPEPVVEVPPLVTAEQAVSQYFSAYQIAALQRLEMSLLQANKPLGPKMSACKTWLEGVMLAWAVDPTPKPAADYGQPAATFEQASAEAVAALTNNNPE